MEVVRLSAVMSTNTDNAEKGYLQICTANGAGIVERARLTETGDFGIGEDDPESKLHLRNLTANSAVQIGFENDARKWFWGVNGGIAGDPICLYDATASATRLVVNDTGYVGIGTTAPDCKIHSWVASAGTVTADASSAICLENSSHVTLQFLTPNTDKGMIFFGDTDSVNVGRVVYDHGTNNMSLYANGAAVLNVGYAAQAMLGLRTSTYDANAVGYLAIANGTQPSAHTDDQIYIGSKDSTFNVPNGYGADGATLSLFLETDLVEPVSDPECTHVFPMWVNGTQVYVLCSIPK